MADQNNPKSLCGCCGTTFVRAPGGYTTLCRSCKNPHMQMVRVRDGQDWWRCGYCGAEGTMSQLEQGGCSFNYAPCPECKGHPYCEPDCALMLGLLESHRTIGF